MKLLRDAKRVFLKSKLLLLMTVLIYGYVINFLLRFYKMPLGSDSITASLDQALKLSFYLFLVLLFFSYEYYLKFQKDGADEITRCTKKGRKNQHLISAFCILTIWIILLSAVIAGFVIVEYKYYGIRDTNNEYIIHILKNIFVNFFLILELASCIGLLLSGTRKRIMAYAVMLLIIYAVSPYPERIADAQCMAGNVKHSIYPIVELFNIMPLVNSGFSVNTAFGESVLFYRISLILFWTAVVILLLFLVRKCRIRNIVIIMVVCLCFGAGYVMPASKVNMNNNPENTMAHDQYYYETGNKTKKEKPQYRITDYDMKLKIGRQLKAKVTMTVSKNLREYPMTLYHGYKVRAVSDQNGNPLKYSRETDYLNIKTNKKAEKITVEYEGASAAYYSNRQGIYLPGDFAYYPRAGYLALYDEEQMAMTSNFVSPDTKFKTIIDYQGKIYTNLDKKGSVYQSVCDGCTIFAGFYKEKKFGDGNRIIYNYLSDECYLEPGGFSAILKEDEAELKKMKKSHVTIFVAPNVNQMRNCDIGQNQILLRNSPWL